MKKILFTFGFVVFLASAWVFWFLMSTTENMCKNEIFKEVNSPSLEFKAVIFQRDCGATAGFNTQVSILKKSDNLPNESGNIFILEGHPNETKLEISWLSEKELNISKPLVGKEFKSKNSIELGRIILVRYIKRKS